MKEFQPEYVVNLLPGHGEMDYAEDWYQTNVVGVKLHNYLRTIDYIKNMCMSTPEAYGA